MATRRSPCRHLHGERLSRGVLRWVAPLAWGALLIWLGQQKGEDLPDSALWEFPGGDKFVHAGAYAVLGALTAWAARSSAVSRAALAGAAAAVVIGLLDEWGQASTAGRDSSWADLVADLVGGALGGAAGHAVAGAVVARYIPRRKG